MNTNEPFAEGSPPYEGGVRGGFGMAREQPPPCPLLGRVSINRCAPRYAAKRRRLLGVIGFVALRKIKEIRSPRVGPVFSGAVSRGCRGENRHSLGKEGVHWRNRPAPKGWSGSAHEQPCQVPVFFRDCLGDVHGPCKPASAGWPLRVSKERLTNGRSMVSGSSPSKPGCTFVDNPWKGGTRYQPVKIQVPLLTKRLSIFSAAAPRYGP